MKKVVIGIVIGVVLTTLSFLYDPVTKSYATSEKEVMTREFIAPIPQDVIVQ